MERPDWPGLVMRMSDRHKGIGSDGVIVVCPPTAAAKAGGAQVRMRMFNADGSESEMCGNGVRCVAKFAHDRLGVNSRPMRVETGRGVLSIAYELNEGMLETATVDMGEPILELEQIPVDRRQLAGEGGRAGFEIRDCESVAKDWQMVSMGNPHAVSFATELGGGPVGSGGAEDPLEGLRRIGRIIETHPAFPQRTNVHIARRRSAHEVEVFTWERGAGITQACGTGVCAVVVAGVLNGQLDRDVRVRTLGGELQIRWDERTQHVFMTGEALDVFEGEWPDR
jgi:diaminopimelate epimerase